MSDDDGVIKGEGFTMEPKADVKDRIYNAVMTRINQMFRELHVAVKDNTSDRKKSISLVELWLSKLSGYLDEHDLTMEDLIFVKATGGRLPAVIEEMLIKNHSRNGDSPSEE